MSLEPKQHHMPSYLKPMTSLSAVQNQNKVENYQSHLNYQEKLEASQVPQKLVLTAEDNALMKKVNQEYFFTRSVPLSLFCGGSVLLANQKGYITKGVKSKFVIAGFVGFMFAKVTMIKTLNDRFLEELPDSDVSNLIRQKRGLPLRAKPLSESNLTTQNEVGSETAHQDDYSYFESTENEKSAEKKNPGMTYDLLRFYNRVKYLPLPDEKSKQTENLDTNYLDSIENSNDMTSENKHSNRMTYDMLREQNRMKYENGKNYVPSNKSKETEMSSSLKSRASQKSQETEIEENFVKPRRSSNKYGDEIFD